MMVAMQPLLLHSHSLQLCRLSMHGLELVGSRHLGNVALQLSWICSYDNIRHTKKLDLDKMDNFLHSGHTGRSKIHASDLLCTVFVNVPKIQKIKSLYFDFRHMTVGSGYRISALRKLSDTDTLFYPGISQLSDASIANSASIVLTIMPI